MAASLLPPGATAAAGQVGAAAVQVPWDIFSVAVFVDEERLKARGGVLPCRANAACLEKVEKFCRERLAVIRDVDGPSFVRLLRPAPPWCHASQLAPTGQGPLSERELGDFYARIASALLPRDADAEPQLLRWQLFNQARTGRYYVNK